MKILVVGSGGREHAVVEALANSSKVSGIYAAPGNGGIRETAEVVDIRADDVAGLAVFAEKEGIELTVVGPEVPLSLGLVDDFRSRDLPVIGPTASDARLESSKGFTKHLCSENGIPTAAYTECATAREAYDVLDRVGYPAVVKANGLAAGKGVVVAATAEEARKAVHDMMESRVLGEAGDRLVIEDFMEGEEASFHVFADGTDFQPMVPAQDHKPRFDGDAGPNTGGMGAYSLDSILTEAQTAEIVDRIIRPTLRVTGTFSGILYAGLMLTRQGPKLVEYNVRLGDPEAQVMLPRLETDLLDVFLAMRDHCLGELELQWKPATTATVVLVADTYPGKVQQGKEISGLDEVRRVSDVKVFHAGTRWEDGRVYTAGGRILNVTAIGETLSEALEKAYAVAEMIEFEGKDYRKDIGRKGLSKDQ